MALLNDIKGIIKPINFISNDNINLFNKSMDNILKAIILSWFFL